MTVTGRTYTSTRPRGLAPWRPQAKALELLDAVDLVLAEYADFLPLTARQVFYRLVGTERLGKTERDYSRLCETLNRARRAGLVDWDAIRDDGATELEPGGFVSSGQFWQAVRSTAHRYERDRSEGQTVALEVWVEAGGMAPQVARVAHPFGATVRTSGGFDSVTAKHEAARRVLSRSRPTVILHVGDHDPSGCALVDAAAEDVHQFCADYGDPHAVRFERIAVTPDQIDRYSLPTAPQKGTDRRGEEMAETVQAEALTPVQLAAEIEDAIAWHIDSDALAVVRGAEEDDRARILAELEEVVGR